ncbi:diguanylate cyclase (GGDEF) domain-containing protein [Geoalkalibacter ferrihydriticus]|uniref:diguanylate cyclase n=1 Tax=Geoalkalibacter ferrihydriticus TaxID=392333 RepID=A0A1G9PCW9_9BACT|nr:diguanylate cyclase [Geoalkalibacter ferrihydriticus]SDL96599.1 diguanylate cyclase (GGDEF) domain-containing protein [Geoalkalibacter ferrihydriticus]
MRLQHRIILLMIFFFLLFVLAGAGATRLLLGPVLLAAEEEVARLNLMRVASALQRESEHLAILITDWAHWDETYRFVQDRNRRFQITNLSAATFSKTRTDLLLFINNDGEVIWARQKDHSTGRDLDLQRLPVTRWPADHPLLNFSNLHEIHSGILATRLGPLQIASSPILTSMGHGPRQGTVIMGRLLGSEEVNRLVEQTRVNFSLWLADEKDLPPTSLRLTNYLETGLGFPELRALQQSPEFERILADDADLSPPEFFRDPDTSQMLTVFTTYPDIYGQPSLLLEVRFPRILEQLSRRISLIVFTCLALVGALFSLAHLCIIRRLITRPIGKLQTHISEIHAGEKLSARLNLEGSDEIGQLASAYNHMLERLEIDHEKRAQAEAELRRNERKFRTLSIRDDLTGLYNARYLYQGLRRQFEKCATANRPLALLFIDIDRFKQVVDTHGHILGSQAIAEMAQTIADCLTKPAFAVAYGGDEYVVVLPGADRNAAIAKADEMRAHIAQTTYLKEQGAAVKLTCSFGVASYPEDAGDLEGLLAIADKSLFYVKSRGRDGVA